MAFCIPNPLSFRSYSSNFSDRVDLLFRREDYGKDCALPNEELPDEHIFSL